MYPAFQELIAEKMGERVKGIMGSPFKRTSKYLSHTVFNRFVHAMLRYLLFLTVASGSLQRAGCDFRCDNVYEDVMACWPDTSFSVAIHLILRYYTSDP